MSRSIAVTPEILAYLAKVNPPEHPALARCREETQKLAMGMMQISAEQGAFMQIMVRLLNVKRAFEVGVFTGYSSLATALTMKEISPDAYILACDVNKEWTDKARTYWQDAGVAGVIDLQLRPATETVEQRLAAGEGGTFDMGFIDADKTSYDAYYEGGLKLLRQGGVMLFDNVLWSGRVAETGEGSADTEALRALALKARDDPRVHAAMNNIGDGVLMCIKR